MRLFQLPGSVLVESETRWFRLQGETWDSVINRADLSGWVTGQIADATLIDGTPDLASLLPPIGSQEIWAAGVTYYRSRTAQDGGGQAGGRRRLLRPRLRRGPSGALLQGHTASRARSSTARADSEGLEVERARAGARAGRQLARRDCRVHDRQRHELARYRGRESAVPAPGQGVRRQLRAGAVRADLLGPAPAGDRGAPGDSTRQVRARSRVRRRCLR